MALTVGTNSWVTLSEGNTYFSERIGVTEWEALTDANKEKYLITAFRWIYYDSAFNVSLSASENAVKYGQCEAALFLISFYDEYNKRDALISSGVKSFKYSKREEELSEVKKPANVVNFFSSVGYYNGGVSLITCSNSETDY